MFFAVSHLLAVMFSGPDPTAGGPWSRTAYVGYNLVLIAMSIAGTALVMATVRPWGRGLPRWLVLLPLGFGSTLLIARGIPGIVEAVLMVTGVAPNGLLAAVNGTGETTSGTTDWTGAAINTYFFVGAIFLLSTTASYARQSRVRLS
jgi:hypothetical protein